MPSKYANVLSEIAAEAIEQFTMRNNSREQALAISREVIRFSANAIRTVHRGQFDEAREIIVRAAARLKETEEIRKDNPEIYFAGFLADARKEFSEANITLVGFISGGCFSFQGRRAKTGADFAGGKKGGFGSRCSTLVINS